ncbi:MAG: hypothetical protein ACSHYF_15715 [Verrucomicrobiaceae bacterium]
MLYIVKEEVELDLPDDWDTRVDEARRYVDTKLQEASAYADRKGYTETKKRAFIKKVRSKAITSRGHDTWQRLASTLAFRSHNKCWYCESIQSRSDKAVDHFRPKNRIEERTDHLGYHWLAFDWQNYRYSCTFCNSRRITSTSTPGGKQCCFPLLDESRRATCETDDWTQEEPALLDPYVRNDTKELLFLSNGQPSPANSDPDAIAHRRAAISIDTYHLNERGINRDRKQIFVDIRKLVNAIDRAENSSEDLKSALLQKVRSTAPYASAARIYLRQYRERAWVQDLLEDL